MVNAIFYTNILDFCFDSKISPPSILFSALSTTNQNILYSLYNITEPNTYSQAIMHSDWQKAMDNEIGDLVNNQTWEVVELPSSKKALP